MPAIVDSVLLSQVLQDTAWQLAFRQGSPRDAEHMQALFGQAWTQDTTRYSDGRRSWRDVERARVSIDEWMNGLRPGDAWLRVAPVDRGWRQERIRVALPTYTRECKFAWKQQTERGLGKRSGQACGQWRRERFRGLRRGGGAYCPHACPARGAAGLSGPFARVDGSRTSSRKVERR
ncbi:MAG TPA: hypothetical protein VFB50_19410 [Chloroflexota bacterium]|nr:hypothetical protein [Chloroflexota bacterium]